MSSPVERRLLMIRTGALLALVVGIVLGLSYYDWPTCDEIQTSIKSMGWHASLCFVVLYILATVFFVPGAILTVISGLVFGPWWGTLYVMIGAITGVSTAFLISRYLARDFVKHFVAERRWFSRIERSLGRNGFVFTLLARLVPIFPYNGLNYACGIVPLRLRDYVLGRSEERV